MFDTLFTVAQHIAEMYGFWGVLFLAFAQEIFPPLPSTVITFSAGVLFLTGEVLGVDAFVRLFLYVGIPIAIGLSIGALVIYGIVYWGGKPVVERWGRFAGVSWKEIEQLQNNMKGRKADDIVLFLARATPVIPSVAINVFAGLVRWPPISFFLNTFFGTVIRSMWVGFLGWQVGNLYEKYATAIEQVQNVILAVVVIGVVGFFIYRRRKAKSKENSEEDGDV